MRTETVVVQLEFVPEGEHHIKARFANPDGSGDEIRFGTMLGRVCMERPDLYERFNKLMADCAVYIVNELYGPEAKAEAIFVDKPKGKLS